MAASMFHEVYGTVVAYGPFFIANLAASQTNSDLPVGQAGVTLIGMPYRGTVVGVSIDGNAAPSAGTVIASVHNASTELSGGPTATIDSVTNTLTSVGLVTTARQHTFSAGARLGVSLTSNGDLAATTIEFNAHLYVRFDPD